MNPIKNIYFIYLLILLSSHTLADTINEERKFTIYAKLPVVPKIPVMEIKTILEIEDKKYNYEFIIESKNIVEFISPVNGKGEVDGIIGDQYQPLNYIYKYTRKNKDKYVEISYDDNLVNKIIVLPDYDKSELSPITENMLVGTIDPSTFFLSLLDYDKTAECTKNFKIFDGKRRYDIIFEEITKNKKNNNIECEAKQIRLGGYKLDEKISDIFASSDYIKVIYSDSTENEFIGYEAKNGSVNIIIQEVI